MSFYSMTDFYNRLHINEDEISFYLIKRCINKDKNKYAWFKLSKENFKKNISRFEFEDSYRYNNLTTILTFPIDKTLTIVFKDGSWMEFITYLESGFHERGIYFEVPQFKPDRYNLVKKISILYNKYVAPKDDVYNFIEGLPIEEKSKEISKIGIFTKIINFIKGKK